MCDCESKNNHTKVIPLLQEEMRTAGYISEDCIREISAKTGVSEAEIYGVATFYAQFRLVPKAKHSISICTGTACFVLGAKTLCSALEKTLGIGDGEVTEDKEIELHYVRCLGCCGLAPVVSVDGKLYSKVTPNDMNDILKSLKEGKDE